MQEQPCVVDLFCGCGGFSLGAEAAGLGPTLAFDNDPILTSSHSINHSNTKLVLADLSKVRGADIRREAGCEIAGVFGGPPCQAFSEIGHRNEHDPRRSLLGHFFRLVAEIAPAFFVMENVKGLGYVPARPVLDRALEGVGGKYRILGPMILDAADFGAATRRRRLFIIGYDPARFDPLTVADIEAKKSKPATVRAAIADLQFAEQIGSSDDFDSWQVKQRGRPSKYAAALRAEDCTFTGHRRTAHTAAVVRRFDKVEQGGVRTGRQASPPELGEPVPDASRGHRKRSRLLSVGASDTP